MGIDSHKNSMKNKKTPIEMFIDYVFNYKHRLRGSVLFSIIHGLNTLFMMTPNPSQKGARCCDWRSSASAHEATLLLILYYYKMPLTNCVAQCSMCHQQLYVLRFCLNGRANRIKQRQAYCTWMCFCAPCLCSDITTLDRQ